MPLSRSRCVSAFMCPHGGSRGTSEDGIHLLGGHSKTEMEDTVPASDTQAASAASADLTDGAWAIAEIEHALLGFQRASDQDAQARSELATAEAAFNKSCRTNAAAATAGFLDRYVAFLPFTADKGKLLRELPSLLETRTQQVAEAAGCAPENVLVNFFCDLQAQGATTAAVRAEVEALAPVVCGASGLGTVLASSIPSGKGRPVPGSAKKSQGPASGPAAVAAEDVLGCLPPAGASGALQEYKDRGQLNMLLAQDFQKLLAMELPRDRHAEMIQFRFGTSSAGRSVRAVLLMPSATNPWLATQMAEQFGLAVGAPPTSFVDINSTTAAKARRGEFDVVATQRGLSQKTLRFQKGPGFFDAYFGDLVRSAEMLREQTGKPAAVLFVDLWSWTGDSAVSLVQWNVNALLRGGSTSHVFGLLHDPKEVHYLLSRCRRNEKVVGCWGVGGLRQVGEGEGWEGTGRRGSRAGGGRAGAEGREREAVRRARPGRWGGGGASDVSASKGLLAVRQRAVGGGGLLPVGRSGGAPHAS